MHWKVWFAILSAALCVYSAYAQGNVQLTLSYVNPANIEYALTVQNNNTGWWVDQVHVLYTTAGVLQATNTPANWSYIPDVPWDAIPYNLRFQPTSNAHRIAPGQSLIFGFKMNTPTPAQDFYIQFRAVNASNQTKEYAYRVKALQPIEVPKDSSVSASMQTPAAGVGGPGPGGDPILYIDYAFLTPTTQFQIETRDANAALRDRVFYPEIPDPPHLEHYFVGNVTREVNATGVRQGDLWTLDVGGTQWCGGAMGWDALYWLHGASQFRRPTVQWRFTPSVRQSDGSRAIQLTLRNTGSSSLEGEFWLYTQGNQLLEGAALRQWRTRFQPSLQRPIRLDPRTEITIPFIIPAGTPASRFFYGELELRQPGVDATRIYFAHQEADTPALIGYMGTEGVNRPVQVQILNPNSGVGVTKALQADAQSVWRVTLEAGDEPLIADSEFYAPTWQARVKPQGALSQTFENVLLPGGDTLDSYLRMQLVLGDANGDDCIDDADLLQVLFEFGSTEDSFADLNLDGVVDDADLLLVLFNFGAGC
ncbi:MAG: hypothetical protein CFK49_10185 [Armatimonadetes bacterium JP3_11]|nr:MAG: hypothetical protein CFK49_10185 [Armatimonadetes bacterium JP3_11]